MMLRNLQKGLNSDYRNDDIQLLNICKIANVFCHFCFF